MMFFFILGVVAFLIGLITPNEGLMGVAGSALCGMGMLVAGFCGVGLLIL